MNTYGVKFTPENLKEFKAQLAKCKTGNDTFDFGGKKWLADYANYLARFLEGVFFTGRQEYISDKD
jgi:hypothetical protein